MAFVPSRIGRYEIKGRIGGGGMGTLYLARDTNPTTDRLVALKLLRTSFDSDELRQRFAREAQALAELNHPNIVIIHDSGEFQDSPFIVMEYVRGETLAESIKRRAPMSLPQKLRLLAELCDGLAHAHEAGIVHRDIKPANLMVDVYGRLKILDFGIARVVDTGLTRVEALTRLNVQIGTPGYMSPEQIEGGEIDARSDLFSVGSVAYELISYREAFPGTTTRQIENKVLGEQPIPLASSIPGLDPEIVDIIASALEKSVERRCQHAETLARAFERVRARLEEEERMPRTTPIPRPGVERKSRHERAAQTAYERAMASYRDGAEGFARRSAMEALAEYPRHTEARHLLVSLGHIRDVEPWLPAPAEVAPAASGPQTDEVGRTLVAQPTVQQPTVQQPTVQQPTLQQPTELWREQPAPPVAPPAEPWREPAQPPPPAPPAPPPVESAPQPAAELPLLQRPVAPVSRPQKPARMRSPLQRFARAALRLSIVVAALALAAFGGAMATRLIWGPTAAAVQLTITKPDGGTIMGDGIQCGTQGSKCSVSRPGGTAVTLQAQADAGFVFDGFTGDCASTGGTVMNAARTCGATFSRVGVPPAGEHVLTIDMPNGGTIEAAGIRCGALGTECSAKQPAGVQVSLSATPSSGFTFSAFTGDCAPAGVTTMSAPRRCGATFAPAAPPPPPTATQWELRIAKPVGGTLFGERIRCGAAGAQCVARYPEGSVVALKQQAAAGYKFAAFTGDCSPSGRMAMTAARNCGASFVKETAPPPPPAPVLTITRPSDGTVFATGINCGTAAMQCSAPQTSGASVTIQVRADPGFKFVAFTGDCDTAGVVVMTSARTCGAMFVKEGALPVSFHLTVKRPANGTIIGDGININCGSVTSQCVSARPRGVQVQLRAQADTGFRLARFTGDCDAAGTTVMTSHRTCGATFVKDTAPAKYHILAIKRPRDGTILGDGIDCGPATSQCSAAFPAGASVQLSAKANPGFRLTGFTDDCSPTGAAVMTTARTCGATFAPGPPGPTSSTPGVSTEVVAGVPLQITAPPGWQQIRWQVSTDGGRSWNDLTNSDDYAGVTTPRLSIKRPRVEMSGHQYRARQTNSPEPASSAAVTLIVKPGA